MRRFTSLALLSLVTSLMLFLNKLAPVEAVIKHDRFTGPQFYSNDTISVQTVASSPFARCQLHTVRQPNGKTVHDWVWFDERPHVNILVRTTEHKFVIFRQRKYALEQPTLAPVGGFIEDGEAALDAAKRELLEELGLRTTHWRALGSYVTSANRGGGRVHAYFADQCVPSERATSSRGDLERQDVVRLSRAALQQALLEGQFAEVKWTATIALALLSLR